MYEQPSRINCSMLPREVEMVFDWTGSAREVNCKRALSNPRDWIERYVKTYLYFFTFSIYLDI